MNDDPKKRVERKLAREVGVILTEKGAAALKKAENVVLASKIKCNIVRDSMHYFMQEWRDVKHPGLLYISCEAVGGNPDDTNDIGTALLFLLGSAHIHDDIIDHSENVGYKSVLARFGPDIALLVGDAFLFEGLTLLYQSCEKLPAHKKNAIVDLTKAAFFEISEGEASEVLLRKRSDVSSEECLVYLRTRAAMAEAVMRIGAIIGDGDAEEIDTLGHYGRTLGLLSAIRDEFVDIFEPSELKNRYRHEILPLPILYAFRNRQRKEEILRTLHKTRITKKDAYMLADSVMSAEEVQKLKNYIYLLINEELKLLKRIEKSEVLETFLLAMKEDI